MTMRKCFGFSVVSMIALSACSGKTTSPPTADDIKNTYMEASSRLPPLARAVKDVNILDLTCQPASPKLGYLCSYTLNRVLFNAQGGKENTDSFHPQNIRFVQDGEKWVSCPKNKPDEGACAKEP